jgi:hypothetical protein
MKIGSHVREKLMIRVTSRHVKLGLQLFRNNHTYPLKLFGRWLNRAYYRRGLLWKYNTEGINVFEEDWDNLLLLDACRYELLDEGFFDAEVESRTSRGSDTGEFLYGNCTDTDLSDTVYVSANPMLTWRDQVIEQNFHDIVHVWEESGWDQRYKTVMPEDVVDRTLDVAETYPNKRLFVHFLQPHYPFISSGTSVDKQQMHDPDDQHLSFWRAVEAGQVDLSKEEIWDLYEANLEYTLPHVMDLRDELTGKTVITSDHGNMVGERASPVPISEWGHPPGIYTDELVKVPWIETTNGPRREITAGDPADAAQADQTVVEDRLGDLGYIT